MSAGKDINERQPKDSRLSEAERAKNEEISERLREKYNAWRKGKPLNESSRSALAKAIEDDLGVTITPATIKKHLSGTNQGSVSAALLCWYAKKLETSVSYLITGDDRPQKANTKPDTVSASDVLDALRLLLETFSNSIEFEEYNKDVAFRCFDINKSGSVIITEPAMFLSLKINSEVIQSQLQNWALMEDIIDQRPDREDKLKEMLFSYDFEETKRRYDSVSVDTGVFYNANERPAFVKPGPLRSGQTAPDAVPAAIPEEDITHFDVNSLKGLVFLDGSQWDYWDIKNMDQKESEGVTT